MATQLKLIALEHAGCGNQRIAMPLSGDLATLLLQFVSLLIDVPPFALDLRLDRRLELDQFPASLGVGLNQLAGGIRKLLGLLQQRLLLGRLLLDQPFMSGRRSSGGRPQPDTVGVIVIISRRSVVGLRFRFVIDPPPGKKAGEKPLQPSPQPDLSHERHAGKHDGHRQQQDQGRTAQYGLLF